MIKLYTILLDFVKYVANTLPLEYRLPKWQLFMTQSLSQLTWRFGLFGQYQNGSVYAPYDSILTYATGDRIQYNFGVYQSLIDSNSGNIPTSSPAAWILCNASFIGMNERIMYNGRYLTLTWALNRYFGTTFRQPPYPAPYDFGLGGGVFSDIYILNMAPTFTSFVSFTTETLTSDVYTLNTGMSASFTTTVTATESSYTFAIYVPLAVYNTLGSTDAVRQSIVRAFTDKYVAAGTSYTVLTY